MSNHTMANMKERLEGMDLEELRGVKRQLDEGIMKQRVTIYITNKSSTINPMKKMRAIVCTRIREAEIATG